MGGRVPTLLLGGMLFVVLLAGCLAPTGPGLEPKGGQSAAPTGPDPTLADGDSAADGADDPLTRPQWPDARGATNEPRVAISLGEAPLHAVGALRIDATLSLEAPLGQAQRLRLVWSSGGTAVDGEAIDWQPDEPTTRLLVRDWTAPPGPLALRLEAFWDDDAVAVAQASLDAIVPSGIRLVLNASAAYTEDVGQNTFRFDPLVPFLPENAESGLDVLARAAHLHGFDYKVVYHGDMDAHYVRMINGTEEVWVVNGFVSRSWMILLNGSLAGAALDHVVPTPDDVLEFRYVQCYATGQCDGTG